MYQSLATVTKQQHQTNYNVQPRSGPMAKQVSTQQQFDISRPTAAPTNANSISYLSSYPSTVSLERKDTLLRLQRFVVQNLYRDIKFIHEQQELDAYDEEDTLSYVVMQALGVAVQNQAFFWSCYKDDVLRYLNSQHCTHTNAIKKVWKGESHHYLV